MSVINVVRDAGIIDGNAARCCGALAPKPRARVQEKPAEARSSSPWHWSQLAQSNGIYVQSANQVKGRSFGQFQKESTRVSRRKRCPRSERQQAERGPRWWCTPAEISCSDSANHSQWKQLVTRHEVDEVHISPRLWCARGVSARSPWHRPTPGPAAAAGAAMPRPSPAPWSTPWQVTGS